MSEPKQSLEDAFNTTLLQKSSWKSSCFNSLNPLSSSGSFHSARSSVFAALLTSFFYFTWHYMDSDFHSVFVSLWTGTYTHVYPHIFLPKKVTVDLLSLGKSASSLLKKLAVITASRRPKHAAYKANLINLVHHAVIIIASLLDSHNLCGRAASIQSLSPSF